MSGVLDGLEILVGPLSGSKLVTDYYAGHPELGTFYSGYPWSLSAFRQRAELVKRRATAARQRVLRESVEPSTPRAAEKLERIANGEGFVVTTGQQAGLFGGPLYTAYKVLTTVRLAHVLEDALRVPVAPLFWLPADDHDWEEVNHIGLLDAANQLKRIELQGEADVAVSMARRRVGEGIGAALDQVAEVLPRNEFSKGVLELLTDAYAPDAYFADAFKQVIAHTFAPYDLLIVASSQPALKRFSVPLIARELEQTERHAGLLRSQTDRLLAAGYHEQVAIANDAANVLYEDEYGRERLVREGDAWLLRRTKRHFSHAEVLALLEAEPERFSPNVLLRPVVESHAFPTLGYVGGPSELSYFAQTGCLFAAHDVLMPLFFPRKSGDLVEAKIRKVLEKFDLEAHDLRRPFHELASQIARDELPQGVSAALQQLRRNITDGYGSLVDAASGIDRTLRGPLEGARNASHKQLEDAERKILQHLKKQNEIGLEQLRKASTNLFPGGERQERVLGTINYLGRYGEALLTGITEVLNLQIDAVVEGWDGVRCA
jgi:bacillithiol biosynthesis cysteine-adding enzyme BshC